MKKTLVLNKRSSIRSCNFLQSKRTQPEPCTYIYYSRPGQMIDKYILAWFPGKGKTMKKINVLMMIISILAGAGLFGITFSYLWLTTSKDFLEIFVGDAMLSVPVTCFMYSYMKMLFLERN